MKKIFLFFVIIFFVKISFSQQEVGLSLHNIWQTNKTNPAVFPDYKLVINAPGTFNQIFFDGPTYNQIIVKDNGNVYLDVDKLINNLDDINMIREDFEIETIGLLLKVKNWAFSFGHSVKFKAFFEYPKALPQLIYQGNSQFIGQTVNLGNNLQIYGYNELGIGVAYKLSNLTAGVKAKFLTGIGDISTVKNDISLYTSDDIYQLTFEADYSLNTAAFFEYSDFENYDFNIDIDEYKFQNIFTENTGFAFDAGLNIDLGKLNLSASIIDIGKINWKDNARNYSANGSYSYVGLDISNALTGDSVTFDMALDTIKEIFNITGIDNEYSTTLPSKIYINAKYDLTESLIVGGGLFYEKFRGTNFPGMYAGVNYKLGDMITVGGTYSVFKNDFTNIGVNAVVKLGPVRVFAMTDNIIAVLNPEKSRYFNFRAGINFVFLKESS